MPDQACPRCAVPLLDQPDYCWSCGFYVGDRWRLEQLGEGSEAEPRIVGPDALATEPRTVGDAPGPPREERWIKPAVVIAAIVIVAMIAWVIRDGTGV